MGEDETIDVWVAVDPRGQIILGTVFDARDKVERFLGNSENWPRKGWTIRPATLTLKGKMP